MVAGDSTAWVGRFRTFDERFLAVGCMLGYVLDGDATYAVSGVRAKIVECGREVALVMGPRDDIAIGLATRFYSRHRRGSDGGEIEVRHALLPM